MNNGYGIYSLWRGWAVTTGAFTLTILLSLWIPKVLLPIVAFGFAISLRAMVKANHNSQIPVCAIIPYIGSRALIWSGIIMLCIIYIYSRGYIYQYFHPESLNSKIPYITVLIVAPVVAVISAWTFIRGSKLSFCVDCKNRHGESVERGFLGILFTQEGRYQVMMLLVFSVILSVISWGYYFVYYINVNINTPDAFFFCWMPLLFTIATYLYMAVRYIGIYSYYCHNVGLNPIVDEQVTRLRFIVICGDDILLNHTRHTEIFNAVDYLDTPASIVIPYCENITVDKAAKILKENTHLANPKVRFMYKVTASNAESNIFHYIVTLASADEINNTTLEGSQWYTIHAIQQLMNERKLTSLLSAEIVRLHDVTMAWKTYDRDGRRLYKIRNYRPTFRLRDIDSWDVDFNDPIWLNISSCNQDTRFWRLRRFWRRYINGLR